MSTAWNDIINTAMIGTEKKSVQKNLLPAELAAVAGKIETSSTDKEEIFLKTSGLVFNYRQAGVQPLEAQAGNIQVCEEEDLSYCSDKAAGVLQSVLSEENDALLRLWMQKCAAVNQVVPPVFLPRLFNLAWRNKSIRNEILSCVGKRGRWLTQFNPHWQFGRDESPAEIFTNGKTDERKTALKQIRQQDPAQALSLLQQCWAQEQANTRADFLSTFKENLSLADEPWLIELTKEKSQKVKDQAYALLKQINGAQLVNEVWEFVKPLVSLKKSSALLGLVNKAGIEISLDFEIPKHFKDFGIEDLVANKLYTEKEFTLSQLIGLIPPGYWETHLSMKPAEILELMAKKEETRKYISSFATAANNFKNIGWSLPLFREYDEFCADLMPLYDVDVREEFALKMLKDNAGNLDLIRPVKEEEWSLKFSIELLKHTSTEPYSFNKNYYRNIILNLPVSLADHLEGLGSEDESRKAYWNTLKEELLRLLMIKKQITASF